MQLLKVTLFVCMLLFGIVCIYVVLDIRKRREAPIFCLMMTGKDDTRAKYAKSAIINFHKQTYSNKFLIIVNEGSQNIIDKKNNRVLELKVQGLSLGKMRNIALDLVPPNAIWTTWDDDDWRSDDYLRTLYDELMRHPTKKYLMFCNRVDHNMNTNFSYRVQLMSGTYIFFAFKDPLIQYDDVSTKEDAVVKQYLIRNGNRTHVFFNNDPLLYIRFIHKSNTSTYINTRKRSITNYKATSLYHEYPVTEHQKEYIDRVKQYFL